MMNERSATLIGVQQNVLDECIRGIYYSRRCSQFTPQNHSVFLKSCLTKMVVVQWCQLFGRRSEDIHWTKVELGTDYPRFDRSHILVSTGLSLPEWVDYHGHMLRLRDKFFAHFDLDSLHDNIPSFDPALKILLSYRGWMLITVDKAVELGYVAQRGFPDSDILIRNIHHELDFIGAHWEPLSRP